MLSQPAVRPRAHQSDNDEGDDSLLLRAPPTLRVAAGALAAATTTAAVALAGGLPLEAARCVLQAGHTAGSMAMATVVLSDARGRPLLGAGRRYKTLQVRGLSTR